MNPIETYAKFAIHPGTLEEFKSRVETNVDVVKEKDPGTLRYDWFICDDKMECVAMDTYRDEESMYAHQANAGKTMAAVLSCADMQVEFLGMPSPAVRDKVMKFGPLFFEFNSGLATDSAALQFKPVEQSAGRGHIEIFTRFTIEPEFYATFKTTAAELLEVVKQNDPGTVRYDWFYDDENCQCIAMDTYEDTAGMLAHMKNANEKHSELLQYSTVFTEFLGELPLEAASAVAKYDPNILPFFKGLKSYSGGGLR